MLFSSVKRYIIWFPHKKGTNKVIQIEIMLFSNIWGTHFLLTPSKTKLKKFLESNVMSYSIIRTSQMSFWQLGSIIWQSQQEVVCVNIKIILYYLRTLSKACLWPSLPSSEECLSLYEWFAGFPEFGGCCEL